MRVLEHMTLQLAKFLQRVGVNDRHRLLRLITWGLLVLTEHLLLDLVLEVSGWIHKHLLIKVSLVLLEGRVVCHHHAVVLSAVEGLHVLLLLLGPWDKIRI